MRNYFTLLFFAFNFFSVDAQNQNKFINSLGKNFEKYYKLDRENIHVHFNKSTYLSNEQVWMNGYVFIQQSKALSFTTNNIFMEVFDSKGTLIVQKLLFAEKGHFKANFPIDTDMKSGVYYFRFYTNWMNNFKEDLSSIYAIEIINSEDASVEKLAYEDIFIELNPESGVFLEEQDNTIGVRLTDYKGNGIELTTGKVYDQNNTVITTFSTNFLGYGRFDIFNTEHSNYRVEVEKNGYKFVKNLPVVTSQGFGLSVVNYSVQDKTIFRIKETNVPVENNYYLIISQDDKMLAYPIWAEDNTIFVDNSELFFGTNIARIIDEDKNVFAERVFYTPSKERAQVNLNLNQNYRKQDSVVVTGKLNTSTMALLSISVLPEDSKTIPLANNIFNSVYLNPYVSGTSGFSSEYFIDSDRIKTYELDLFFLNQKPEEQFTAIATADYPKPIHSFENGISIKGKVNRDLKRPNSYKITLFSLEADLWESVNLNANNEFYFENLIVSDSTWLNFTLTNRDDKLEPLYYTLQVQNNKGIFLKQPRLPTIQKGTIETTEIPPHNDFIEQKMFANHIEIETIEIKSDRRDKLKKVNQNPHLRALNTEEFEMYIGMRITEYLMYYYRFSLGEDPKTGNPFMFANNITNNLSPLSKANSATPLAAGGEGSEENVGHIGFEITPVALYINDMRQYDAIRLLDMWMSEVEEIYIDRTGSVPGIIKNFGVVKVYTKDSIGNYSPKANQNVKPFQITNGFSKFYTFTNTDYILLSDIFKSYGAVEWKPGVITDDKGNFIFSVPLSNQKHVKVHIEGITEDGKLFSELKEIYF